MSEDLIIKLFQSKTIQVITIGSVCQIEIVIARKGIKFSSFFGIHYCLQLQLQVQWYLYQKRKVSDTLPRR